MLADSSKYARGRVDAQNTLYTVDNAGEEVFNLPVISETEECEIKEVEILTYKDSSEVLNFKTR